MKIKEQEEIKREEKIEEMEKEMPFKCSKEYEESALYFSSPHD